MLCLGLFLLFFVVIPCIPYLIEYLQECEAAQAKAREEAADLELQKNHPEVWKNKELIKLEKERLAMQQKLAEQQLAAQKELADKENTRRNVGLAADIFRIFGS